MTNEAESTNPEVTTQPLPAPLAFEIEELGKKENRWRLEIRPGDLALFENNDLQPYILLREQFLKEAFLAEPVNALSLKKPRKITLKLTPDATAAVAGWLGKSMLAGLYLQRRYAWVLPVAVLWLIGSLPIPGDSQGMNAKPLDILGMGLGFSLIVAWAFAKWRPHSVLFLVDSIWFLWVGGYIIYDVVHGANKLKLIFAALMLSLVVSGVKHYKRFRGTHITPLPKT